MRLLWRNNIEMNIEKHTDGIRYQILLQHSLYTLVLRAAYDDSENG